MRRGTWFNLRYGRWYELDGFLVRKNERHWMIERMRTKSEWGLSDHRPKLVRVKKDVRKWRTSGRNERGVPKIKWEVLQDENKREEYMERTRVLMNECDEERNESEWKVVSEVMVRAAREVCGVREKGVSNPWVIGHEEHVRSLMMRVNEAVNERNESVRLLNARHGMRTRQGGVQRTLIENRVANARSAVRVARKDVKRFMKRIEREWWSERISECKDA